MPVWIVLNNSSTNNVFAGIYDDILLAMQAIKATYAALGQTVTFTPAAPLPTDAPSKQPTNSIGQVAWLASGGNNGVITRQSIANQSMVLYGF